jgi:polyhydroxybutyrate depolymerase
MKTIAVLLPVLLGLLSVQRVFGDDDPLTHLQSGGLDRTYLIHVPATLPKGSVPLVVVLHGGGGSAAGAAKQTHFDVESDQGGFIVAYPDGTGRSGFLMRRADRQGLYTWNAGNCCGYAEEHAVDDVGFIRALVMQLEKDYSIDPKRIYATGLSNGAMLSYRLACEASDLFAAVGTVSGGIEVPDCKPSNPVSVIHIHGSADENIPLDGGVGRKAWEKENHKPIRDTIDFWTKQDGCPAAAESTQGELHVETHVGCKDGTAVVFYVIVGGGHAWPGGEQMAFFLDKPSTAMDATAEIWKFFAAHPKH